MATPYYNADPVIVQGKAVDGSSFLPLQIEPQTVDGASWTRGEKQPNSCRDAFWAVLFYVHLGAIGIVTAKFAPLMAEDLAEGYASGSYNNYGRRLLQNSSRWLEDQNSNEQQQQQNIDISAIFFILGVSGIVSCIASTLAMTVMSRFAQGLIKISLFFNVFGTFAIAMMAVSAGSVAVALMAGLAFLFSLYYAYVVWNRIPFAASNLVTAIAAVRANIGLAFFAYSNLIVSFLWSIWWAIAFIATTYVVSDCDAEANCQGKMSGWFVFLFFVSFFWTATVIKNVVHVTVAGTVGTWWFTPIESSGCCSQGVRDSYVRSITSSFGSICLGSLIVAIISATKEILHAMREQDTSVLLCIAECLLGCIESLVEYFNQWAFVYVGLYGYSFMDAGRNVMRLFRSRGWTAIVTDFLVDTVLLMVSIAVGVLTGGIVVLISGFSEDNGAVLGGTFVAGMLIGFIMCSTLFSLIGSAVNACIVCYAEAPAEFQVNHPQLSEGMHASWRQAYPNEFHY